MLTGNARRGESCALQGVHRLSGMSVPEYGRY
nr:MAG TPA: hypothetical protein [Caudoviricetes sp.]